MIRTIVTFAFILVAIAARADTLTLASKYDVVGTNPNGSKYAGTATIEVIPTRPSRFAGTSAVRCSRVSACA